MDLCQNDRRVSAPYMCEDFNKICNAGGEFRTRDLQIMSIALVGEPLEITKRTGTLTRLSYPGILYA